MKNIVIIGAGGFGREVQWLLERMNEKEEQWNLLGYIDDGVAVGTIVDGLPVLGNITYLIETKEPLAVVCAVGSSKTRKQIIDKIIDNENLAFPNVIDPSVQMSERICMGKGNIICAGNIMTVDIEIGDFNIINLDCTVGHDAVLHSYVTVYPSVNISGCVEAGDETELGTGSHIIQGIHIGEKTIIGAGSVVIRDMPSNCTAVGNPARPIKFSGREANVVIAGASGHGKVLADIAKYSGYQKVILLDDDLTLKQKGITAGNIAQAVEMKGEYEAVVAIGNATTRKIIQEKYEREGVKLATIIHPNAYLAENVKVGIGSVIMAGAVVQPGCTLGKGVIVNTSSSIDHDCKIGNYCHISVGSHIAGTVCIGDNTWIGAGATVSNNITICNDVMIGAGAVVVKDIMEPGTYVGVPAKKIG